MGFSFKNSQTKIYKPRTRGIIRGERVRWASIIRGNTWVNTLDELIDLEHRTSRRKA